MSECTAIAHPNIALVKYWGKRNIPLNLPATPSLSLTLAPFETRTTVRWGAEKDQVVINGAELQDTPAQRVLQFLDLVDPERPPCTVESHNNFPTAAGLASSSSAFAALALAATHASGQSHDSIALSRLARQGSGSACRSLWGGWVAWPLGEAADGSDCHGVPLAPADHWDLRMVVAAVDAGPKHIGSTAGMIQTRDTSPMYPAWVASGAEDLNPAIQAVKARDLEALGTIMERSTLRMHATMLTAEPSIRYLKPNSWVVLDRVEALRRDGVQAWFTMDAGPNVKILCAPEGAQAVADAVRDVSSDVFTLVPGGDPRVVS